MNNQYIFSPAILIVTLLLALVFAVIAGWSGIAFVSVALFVTYLGVLLPQEERIDMITLDNTSYRLISVEVADGQGGKALRYRVEKSVAFPIGWGGWVTEGQPHETQEAAQGYYTSLINDRKAMLVALRTKYSYGTNAQLLSQVNLGHNTKDVVETAKKGRRSKKAGVEPSQAWPR